MLNWIIRSVSKPSYSCFWFFFIQNKNFTYKFNEYADKGRWIYRWRSTNMQVKIIEPMPTNLQVKTNESIGEDQWIYIWRSMNLTMDRQKQYQLIFYSWSQTRCTYVWCKQKKSFDVKKKDVHFHLIRVWSILQYEHGWMI